MGERPVISRGELKRIVDRAIPSDYGFGGPRLRKAAEVTTRFKINVDLDPVLVGRDTLAGQAGLQVDAAFRTLFDRFMREHLNLGPEPVVVEVTDEP